MAYLWTPIANAVDSYRRRLLIEPSAFYEHTWRLIHIHEALVVTLGTALATRLFTLWDEQPNTIIDEDLIIQTKKIITGLNPNQEDPSKNPSSGCLSGSISEWINLLNSAKNFNLSTPCPFIENLKNYIEKFPEISNNNSLAFLNDWERIAPVPLSYREQELTSIKRFRAINELRNKLAHVPISARILPNLHKNLRK